MSAPFPFSAIVAQEDMKKALLMAAVEPLLGGVLIFGDRGTGKSTAVRALAELLPKIDTRAGCRFNCSPDHPQAACPVCTPVDGKKPPKKVQIRTPMIDLPLGATEDRICGALDLEKALVAGEKDFEPGLLAAANQGFLYIDEVNLLEDHLVDLLLDAAASGVNVVEREGLSIRHAARFALVGSGNPEEGDLRPQLLDRFGLSVEIRTINDLQQRIEVIRRRDAFEADTDAFVAKWSRKDAAIRSKVVKARKILRQVDIPDDVLSRMSQLCMSLGIDGMRGELTLMRACRASAALAGRLSVTWADVSEISPMVLCHRLRRDPLDDAGSAPRIERAVAAVSAEAVSQQRQRMDDVRSMQAFDAARPELASNTWQDALLAAQVLKAGGARLGGLWLKARAGGVRDAYLDHLAALLGQDKPWVRVPSSVSLQGLTGSVDIPATALAGRVITQPGLLAKADQGVLLIPMAERVEAPVAALIGETMDRGMCPKAGRSADSAAEDAANFLVIAVDEGADPEEHLPKALGDRLGLMIDLNAIPWSAVASHSPGVERNYTATAADVIISDDLLGLLSRLACAAGVSSLRTLKHLSRLCRTLAALEGCRTVSEADALTAVRLCLGLSLAAQPNDPVEETQPQPAENDQSVSPDAGPKQDPESRDQETSQNAKEDLSALTELLAAVEAGTIDGLPEFLADTTRSSPRARSGKSGTVRKDARRGRPVSTSRMPPRPDARPNILATLRAAAPWQLIRNRNRDLLAAKLERSIAAPPRRKPRTLITRDDYRYQRLRHETPSTAIFVVDASGSTALERLGETKGAIEQLLSRCYVRRDEVAMIAFRGIQAETLLSPTRSLVMAKRKLAGLPGGGPTPLAAGLERGLELALSVRRQGSTPVLVLMTDGRGNIALDGSPDRMRAAEQVHALAEQCRAHEIRAICIDIARRPRESVSTLASTMGADLHILRHADSRAMSDLVNASLEEARS